MEILTRLSSIHIRVANAMKSSSLLGFRLSMKFRRPARFSRFVSVVSLNQKLITSHNYKVLLLDMSISVALPTRACTSRQSKMKAFLGLSTLKTYYAQLTTILGK